MADTHEEQLLSHWLRDIARQDERLRADHLEVQVMSAVRPNPDTTAYRLVRLMPDTTYYMKAAAIVISVVFPAVLWMRYAPAEETVRRATNTPSVVVPETIQEPAVDARAHNKPVQTRPTPRMRTARRTAPANPAHLTNPTNPTPPSDEFVPLMPMTAQELTGSFQIVRVQMPRASLGALRSPLDHPNELVEADVLLGEDGMAPAIRVSASGSVYPWRSR